MTTTTARTATTAAKASTVLANIPRPNSPDAERALLGSIMLDPRVIPEVAEIVETPAAFYNPFHGRVYQAIAAAAERTPSLDSGLLLEALKNAGVVNTAEDQLAVEGFVLGAASPAFAVPYARQVRAKHRVRQLIDAAGATLHECVHGCPDDDEGVKDLLDRSEARIFAIAHDDQVAAQGVNSLEALLHDEYARQAAALGGHGEGVHTGFADLDEALGGLQKGDLIILAARPSVGKTAFAMNIAEQAAMGTDIPGSTRPVRDRVPVGVFSLEMSQGQLVQRLLSSWTGLTMHQMRSGHLPADGLERVVQATTHLGKAPIYVDASPGLTLMSLRGRARRMQQQHKVGVLIVDYLQLLKDPTVRENRQVEVSSISRGLKELARELEIPVIALSQLNRSPEGREDGRPRLGDLRESGALEQDADVVLLLHRPAAHFKNDPAWEQANPHLVNHAEIIIAKQRNGPLGTHPLVFDGPTTRFKTASKGGAAGAGVVSGFGINYERPLFPVQPKPAPVPAPARQAESRSPAFTPDGEEIPF